MRLNEPALGYGAWRARAGPARTGAEALVASKDPVLV